MLQKGELEDIRDGLIPRPGSDLSSDRISDLTSDLCVFQFKLAEVEEVVLLTKKGYLTIALSHTRDGRVLLRRHEGIRDWFNVIKVTI